MEENEGDGDYGRDPVDHQFHRNKSMVVMENERKMRDDSGG